MKYLVTYEELWEPWEISPANGEEHWRHRIAELPDDLVSRFLATKKDLEDIWLELDRLLRDDL